MSRKTKTTATEQTVETPTDPFANVRTDLIEIIGGFCSECGDFPRSVKVSPIAKEIGVPAITLTKYVRGDTVGYKTLGRFVNFIRARKGIQNEEQAEALAEVAALD